MKAYWASLSPEDERLREQYLTMTPEEKMLDIEHENPVLTAVGDTVEGVYGEADEPVALTITGIQADGYVAYIDLEGFEPGSFDFDFSMDRKVISPIRHTADSDMVPHPLRTTTVGRFLRLMQTFPLYSWCSIRIALSPSIWILI